MLTWKKLSKTSPSTRKKIPNRYPKSQMGQQLRRRTKKKYLVPSLHPWLELNRNQNPFLLSQEKLTLMKETWKCHQEMLSFTNLSMDQKNPWSSRMDKLNQNMGERHPSLQWLLSPLGKQTLTHLPHLLFLHGHISHHHGQPLQLFGPSRHPHCQTFPHGSIRSTRTKVHGTS